jgi:hypothetical protein
MSARTSSTAALPRAARLDELPAEVSVTELSWTVLPNQLHKQAQRLHPSVTNAGRRVQVLQACAAQLTGYSLRTPQGSTQAFTLRAVCRRAPHI